MKEVALKALITIMLKTLSQQDLKVWADKAIDLVENKVTESDSKLDDTLILPMCAMIRKSFDIPDND